MMNPLGLCHFYPMDPVSMFTLEPLKSPAMAEHLKGLLLLIKTQQQPYIIVVFQGVPISPLGLLQELHTRNALARIPIFRSDETKDGQKPCMLCCPFCMYTIQNDLAYLNHIVGVLYNENFTCGTCLSAITMSGQQMKRHIIECPELATPPLTMLQESACSECSPKKSTHGSKHTGSKKKGCHSEKSQSAGATSQEDSQTRDRCITRAAGASQESAAESSRHHSWHKKKVKTHKEKKFSE